MDVKELEFFARNTLHIAYIAPAAEVDQLPISIKTTDRKTDAEAYQLCYESRSFLEFERFFRCSKVCPFGGVCISKITIGEIAMYRFKHIINKHIINKHCSFVLY